MAVVLRHRRARLVAARPPRARAGSNRRAAGRINGQRPSAAFALQVSTPPGSAGLRLFNCDTLKFPRVPARVSEALVLRTYPFKEADLVVSFLTRDQGKLRGVAKRARRPKSTFGSGLERLSHVRMAYFQRESHELVNLDSCELIRSQFDLVTSYQASIALDYFAEASELLLPSAEPSEKFFRLLVAVLESLRPAGGEGSLQAGRVWRAVTYFHFGRCGFRGGCRNCMFASVAAACWMTPNLRSGRSSAATGPV